jgi:hypothetical protein
MPVFVTEYPQFFTASIKGWYKLLEHDKYKDIVVNSLRFLTEDKRITLNAFVIMPGPTHSLVF